MFSEAETYGWNPFVVSAMRRILARNGADTASVRGRTTKGREFWQIDPCRNALFWTWLVNSQNKRKPATEPVSELTTNRLSVYLRCLNQLESAGVDTISSQALAEQFHLNAAQIRKDLAYFGEFGVRGVGYYVKDLKRHLRQILGLDRKLRVAVMGAGNLGLALADYPGFKREGFEIVSMFDVADAKIGDESRSGVPIHDLKDLKKIVRKEHIDIAVIAVPAESAQHVLDQVVAAGIKAILNFSPGALKVPPGVKMKGVDLTVSLESLSFYLAQGIDDEG
jgi:redox-sensing transcriptional repressor